MKTAKHLCLALAMGSSACAQSAQLIYVTQGTPRNAKVENIIIHATGGPDCNPNRSFKGGTLSGIVAHFKRNSDRISIHYVVGRNGGVVRMVPEDQVAWHIRGHNQNSIGIELVNNGDGRDSYPTAQIDALTRLLKGILARYALRVQDIKAHSDLDDTVLTCNGRQIRRK
jgi:N-acetylmuramoyl-L-alanine amidase